MDTVSLSRRVALITFVGGLGGGLVFPILPALGLSLGIPGLMIGFILSANRISRLICDHPAGRVVDKLGGRRALSGALFIETIGVLGYSAALHFGHPALWLLAGRAVYGVGSAFLLVGAQATILSVTKFEDRGRRTATVRVALSSGMPAGLIMGGVIADLASDDAAFLTGASLTLIGSILAAILLPSASKLPVAHAPKPGRTAGGLKTLMKNPNFPVLTAVWGFNLLVFLTLQGVLLATMVVLMQERDLHLFGMRAQGTSGLMMAVMMASSSVMAFVTGRLIDKVGRRSTLVIPALTVLAAGYAVLAFASNLGLALLGVILVGISYNGVNLPMLALLGDVTKRHYGRAVGIYQVFGDIGGSLGPIIGLEAGINLGLTSLYLAIAALTASTITVAVWLRRRENALAMGESLPG